MTLDIAPRTRPCMRCRQEHEMRFYGMCDACTAELHAKYADLAQDVEVTAYEPKMNVTPNAVALKDD